MSSPASKPPVGVKRHEKKVAVPVSSDGVDDILSLDLPDSVVGIARMRTLSCPFTWNVPVVSQKDIDLAIDRLSVVSCEWENMIQKFHLAYYFCRLKNFEKSLSYIAECFLPILEIPGLETNDIIPRVYRHAWKYVLDATSTFIRIPAWDDQNAHIVNDFIKSIPDLHSLDIKQRAAVFAIRSRFFSYPENRFWIQEALKLNPEEGMWHYYQAQYLYEADVAGLTLKYSISRDSALEDVLRHNQVALQMRRDTPEPFFLMANLLVHYGDEEASKKSYICVQNAIKQFPDNAWVHEKAAEILQQSQPSFPFMPKSYLLIEPFYKKALKLARKECLSLRHKLGIHQVLFGLLQLENYEGIHGEGISNLELASTLIDDAKIHLRFAKEGKLNPSAFGVAPIPQILLERESSSEESYVSHRAVKVYKKKKKSKKKRKH